MRTPEVSVVMGVYNGAEYLEQTLASVLSQEGCDLEFIVVDDGSTDDTGRILDEWAARDKRLRVIHQQNTGLTRALIRGCAEARGEFIARQDAGDVSLPGRLAAQCSCLRDRSGCVAATCYAEFVGPMGEFLFTVQQSEKELNHGLSATATKLRAPPHHGSVMMRRRDYISAGGYRQDFFFAQDLDLWTRLVELGCFIVIPQVHYRARLEANSITGTSTREQRYLAKLIHNATIARNVGGQEALWVDRASTVRPGKARMPGKRLAHGNYFIGCCLMHRDPASAGHYFRQAIRCDPMHWKAWLKYALSKGLELF